MQKTGRRPRVSKWQRRSKPRVRAKQARSRPRVRGERVRSRPRVGRWQRRSKPRVLGEQARSRPRVRGEQARSGPRVRSEQERWGSRVSGWQRRSERACVMNRCGRIATVGGKNAVGTQAKRLTAAGWSRLKACNAQPGRGCGRKRHGFRRPKTAN